MPACAELQGRSVRLVPMGLDHMDALWPAVSDAPESFEFLRYGPFGDQGSFETVIQDLSTRADQPFWTIFTAYGQAMGWLSICDVYQSDGAFEIGSILFSPKIQGARIGREAIFLLMCRGMDGHGYERLVWRCQAQNKRSVQAALNLGFCYEGTWRNAAIVAGWQRDVAWFSILKSEWPARRAALEAWLSDSNFDENHLQIKKLQAFHDLS